MEKDEKGLWSVTSKALAPDYYVYSMVVDGVAMKDPRNPLIKYNLFNTESQVHVPDVGTQNRHHCRHGGQVHINAQRPKGDQRCQQGQKPAGIFR